MGTIDIDFGKLRECDAIVIGAKAMYVVIGPWSLATKLVAREIKNDEAPILVCLINSFEVCILRSITTLCGRVDNKLDMVTLSALWIRAKDRTTCR